jgi:hypothetical protein
MVLIIRLKTDKTPEAFATFDLEMKDGSVIRTCAVLDKVEKIAVWYRHNDTRYLRVYKDLGVYDVEKVVYEGSECTPNQEGDKHATVYAFKVEVEDPCLIKENAKLIVVYKDGTKEEICGKYAGVAVYYVEYRSCVDVDTDKLSSVVLVSMGFRPIQSAEGK